MSPVDGKLCYATAEGRRGIVVQVGGGDRPNGPMPDFLIELIGYAAASVTTLCWLPQAIRLIRTRETRAISLFSYSAFSFGIALWLTYGLLIGNLPIIVANVVTLTLTLVIVAIKLRYG